jgi:hypothetical protein
MTNSKNKNTDKIKSYLIGTLIGIIVFLSIPSINFILANPLNIIVLITTLPFTILFLGFFSPFFVLAAYLSITSEIPLFFHYIPLFLLLVWTFILFLVHSRKNQFSNTKIIILNSILIVAGFLPFLIVQMIGIESIPILNDTIIAKARYHYVYPPERFLQIYWAIPLWFITWFYSWNSSVLQDLVKKKSLSLSQIQWLTWFLILSVILIMNPISSLIQIF